VIVDSSALVAIARSEPLAEKCLESLERARGSLYLAAPTYVEVRAVATRDPNPQLGQTLDALILEYDITIVSFDPDHAQIARSAYERYGRGTGHPAKLNFGDCFAYALARERNEPLLFVGDDFTHTDIRPALATD
jgi:ribonuclease VapC